MVVKKQYVYGLYSESVSDYSGIATTDQSNDHLDDTRIMCYWSITIVFKAEYNLQYVTNCWQIS